MQLLNHGSPSDRLCSQREVQVSRRIWQLSLVGQLLADLLNSYQRVPGLKQSQEPSQSRTILLKSRLMGFEQSALVAVPSPLLAIITSKHGCTGLLLHSIIQNSFRTVMIPPVLQHQPTSPPTPTCGPPSPSPPQPTGFLNRSSLATATQPPRPGWQSTSSP